ncbi:DUF624 domain-containing protein [Amphibacillus jilinensis]|uniref:DUF624 domain-containing protein n=1 Tax=Amphibacillus jilinensis TaxID=1216008 RepID=UPI000313B835|nr:DUF624 domain-containing protein [Amphibacillus jilinensis]
METVYKFCVYFIKFFSLSVKWLVATLPVWFILSHLLMANSVDRPFFILTLLFLLAFSLIPATIALFSVVRHWVIHNQQDSIEQGYFYYLKKTYKQSLVIGLFITIATGILIVDIVYFSENQMALFYLFLFVAFAFALYALCLLITFVHYDFKLNAYFKKALLLLLHLKFSVRVILLTAIFIIIGWYSGIFYLAFLSSLYSYLLFALFYRIYLTSMHLTR